MTTTRVTVPPHALEAIAFNLCSLHDFDVAFVRENERFATSVITEYVRTLSAAPAPEGGAVKRACVVFQEAIDDFEADVADVMAEGSERADLWDREITVNIDALKTVMSAALATRHEAPAEPCFECGSTERTGTACKPCNPEITDPNFGHEAPAEGAGEMFGDETAEQIVRRWADWINDVSDDMEQPDWGGKTLNDVLNERDFLIRAITAAPTQPLAEGADAEKLRVALEALLRWDIYNGGVTEGFVIEADFKGEWVRYDDIDQALAALQQEGR